MKIARGPRSTDAEIIVKTTSAHDARIARLESKLAEAKEVRAAYIASVNAKVDALRSAVSKG
jgi:hypothetical protein